MFDREGFKLFIDWKTPRRQKQLNILHLNSYAVNLELAGWLDMIDIQPFWHQECTPTVQDQISSSLSIPNSKSTLPTHSNQTVMIQSMLKVIRTRKSTKNEISWTLSMVCTQTLQFQDSVAESVYWSDRNSSSS